MSEREHLGPAPAGGRRRSRWKPVFFGGLAATLAVQWFWTPVLLQNTQSLDRGMYLRGFGPIEEGSIVAVPFPASIVPLLERHGKPTHGQLLKPVVAVGPATLDTLGERAVIDGVAHGEMAQTSSIGVAYPEHRTRAPLEEGQLWLESTRPSSVDSRVFGPVRASEAKGPYHLVWRWQQPEPAVPIEEGTAPTVEQERPAGEASSDLAKGR